MGESSLELLARRLNYAGIALVAAAGLAFVWAVGFTRGVEGLIEGLVVAGVGLFLPGAATLWVAWIIGSAAASHPRPRREAPAATRSRPALRRLRHYGVAVVAVVIAALVRGWLAPYLGNSIPYATFFLAVALAAWAGGLGPGVFAALLSVLVAWKVILLAPAGMPTSTAEWIGAALFISVSLAIAGITSALYLARRGNEALRIELALHDAVHDEAEDRMRELADEAPAMLWWCGRDGRCVYVNAAWRAFTGSTLDDATGDGWQHGIHPDDVDEWRALFTKALHERQPFAVEYRRKRNDGEYRRVMDSGRPRIVGERGFAGFAGRTIEAPARKLASSPSGTPTEGRTDAWPG